MKIKNNGVLDLEFALSGHFDKAQGQNYEKASGGGDEYISSVAFGTINNSSGSEGYADYTGFSTKLTPNNSYEITVLNGNPYNGDQCAVWVDWDQNNVFDEQTIILNWIDNKFTGIITPSKGITQGATGMRIRLTGPGQLSPYGDTEYGETEDYRVFLEDWLTMEPEDGLVAVGDSLLVNLTYDATSMATGTYSDLIKLITNDVDNVVFNIPVTMHVTDLQTTASADPSILCLGESTQLSVELSGGSGSFTYQWYSIPEGFESDEQNPVAIPTANMKYIVLVNDGVVTISDTVDITILDVPEVNLGGDQVLCDIDEYELDAGNPGAAYLWSTGETTQTVTVSGEGTNTYWVDVTNENNCTSTDTIIVNFATSPVIELGADTVICHNSVLTLDAGNPGSSYLWSTGETSQTISINGEEYEDGNYDFSVLVTLESGCENGGGITIEIKDCTSIDENQQLVNISVFPNPNKGIFNVQLNTKNSQSILLSIMNLSGMIVYESENLEIKDSHSMQIDLSNIANGVYSIFVIGENGTTEKKVILQK